MEIGVLIAVAMAAAFGWLVTEVAKVGVITRPAWAAEASPRAGRASDTPSTLRRKPRLHGFSQSKRRIGPAFDEPSRTRGLGRSSDTLRYVGRTQWEIRFTALSQSCCSSG